MRTFSGHMPFCVRSTIRSLRPRLLLAAIFASLLVNARGLPLRDGEELGYRVSWAVVPGAGEIKIAAVNDVSAPRPSLRVTTTTSTRRLARLLLPFDARAESVFDLDTGRLLSLSESSHTRDKHAEHTVTFDPAAHSAAYQRAGDPAARTLAVPPGDPTDLIMGLLQTRTWDLKPGERREALVLFDDDFYELTIHFARYEEVRTPLGTFNTVVLEPRMDRSAPKGMFRRGGSVRVWIAQNEERLPVRFEVEFKIGTGTATLETYTPPKASHAANPRS
jgi:hypothetical protein